MDGLKLEENLEENASQNDENNNINNDNEVTVDLNKYNKLKKALKIETICIIVCIILFTVLQFLPISNNEYLLCESSSKSKFSSVKIYEVGKPFFFGPSSIRIVYSNEDFQNIRPIDTKLCNDGAALYESNYKVTWEGETAVVTLHGSEQADVTFKITSQKNKE